MKKALSILFLMASLAINAQETISVDGPIVKGQTHSVDLTHVSWQHPPLD